LIVVETQFLHGAFAIPFGNPSSIFVSDNDAQVRARELLQLWENLDRTASASEEYDTFVRIVKPESFSDQCRDKNMQEGMRTFRPMQPSERSCL
jgi:hypothetical protein